MKKKLKTWLAISAASLGIHYLLMFFAWIVGVSGSISFGQMLLKRLTEPGDAIRYLDIAQNGYVKTGENAINLVFYPLYPLLLRAVSLFTGNLPIAGVILSQGCYCMAAVALYELILLDGDKRMALDGVLLMALYPFSVFTMGVFSESLFLLTTLLCLYALRKGNYVQAGIVGFFASLSRTQGMLLIFPAVYEVVARGLSREKRKLRFSDCFLLLIPAGFGVYLLINYILHGNFFQFLIYEEGAPWYQSTKWLGDNLSQHMQLANDHPMLSMIIYYVQLALYFIVLLLLFLGLWKKERMAHLLYGGVYLGFTYLSGWMISGGRYMLGCIPIFLVLGKLKMGWGRNLVFLISGILCFIYTTLYLIGHAIM